MSLLTDIRNVSDNAIEQLSTAFRGLPRPLLAAIGAGDLAVERLAVLREQLTERLGVDRGIPSRDDVKAIASDLPARAQQIANDIARQVEQYAQDAPERVQRMIGELPNKASELTESLAPDKLRSTVDGYTQLVASIYENLADRGDKVVAKARTDQGEAGKPSAKAVGDEAPARPNAAGTRTTGKRATTAKSAGSQRAKTPGTRNTGRGTPRAAGDASPSSTTRGRAPGGTTGNPAGRPRSRTGARTTAPGAVEPSTAPDAPPATTAANPDPAKG